MLTIQIRVVDVTEANVNLTTVAIVPLSDKVPLHQFALDLENALAEICSCIAYTIT